ncbi:MAG: 16S rRNA pseudouridine(516) synthase [Rickettsiales bacterium]|nr:16S rRNA pseudouridine(516) synthase [Rickettsiales bacterium]
MSNSIRIDKLLAGMGYGSRREIESLADTDRLLIDGQPVLDCSMRVVLDETLRTRLTVDGEIIDPLPGMVVMLHKPLGVTCSHKESGKLIYDLLPSRWKRREPVLSSIGRLDKETSGLLLLTDDGVLLHKVISPKQHIAKRYVATLARPLNGDEANIFARGTLMLEGEKTPLQPAELEVLSATSARLQLHEGRYHQVRRMFAAVGNHVATLHRESVGGLMLPDDLSAGDYRVLKAEEIAHIFAK